MNPYNSYCSVSKPEIYLSLDSFSFSCLQDRRNAGESSRSHRNYQRDHNGLSVDKNQIGGEITDQSEDDSSRSHHEPTRWRR